MDPDAIVSRISNLVESEIHTLAPHHKLWFEEHLIVPHQIDLSLKDNGEGEITLWLVTDHVGNNDSSYRIVYDPEHDMFGLEVTIENGVNWYMGRYGNLLTVVNAM